MSFCKIRWWKMSMKKEKNFFVPNLQHFQFGQDGWKTFFIKISWIWTCSQIFRKFKEEMYNTMNLLSVHIYSKIIFLLNKYTYTAHQYWGKVSKIFYTFPLYLRLPAIMNLIFCTVRLEKFVTSCRDRLYHHTVSNKIKFNFLIILFD